MNEPVKPCVGGKRGTLVGAVLGAPRVGAATPALDTALELPPLVTGREASAATGNASEGSCNESSGT